MPSQNAVIIKISTNQVYANKADRSEDKNFLWDFSGYDQRYYYVLRGQYPTARRGDVYNSETGEFISGGRCPEDVNPYVQWSEELEDLAVGALKPLVDHLIRHPFNVLGYLKPSEYAASLHKTESAVVDTREDYRQLHRPNPPHLLRGEDDRVWVSRLPDPPAPAASGSDDASDSSESED